MAWAVRLPRYSSECPVMSRGCVGHWLKVEKGAAGAACGSDVPPALQAPARQNHPRIRVDEDAHPCRTEPNRLRLPETKRPPRQAGETTHSFCALPQQVKLASTCPSESVELEDASGMDEVVRATHAGVKVLRSGRRMWRRG